MSNNTRLLVVEDDPNLGRMLTDYLRARGYEADLRTDGQQGAQAYGKGKYDLILLDVMMPQKDGFTLAGRSAPRTPRCPSSSSRPRA